MAAGLGEVGDRVGDRIAARLAGESGVVRGRDLVGVQLRDERGDGSALGAGRVGLVDPVKSAS